MSTKVTVFFPVHNEADGLEELYAKLDKSLASITDHEFEILFIDDKSTDNSLEILHRFAEKDARVRVISHETQRGQAGGIDTGLREATGDIIVFMDADLQHQPEDIPKFIEEIHKGFDAVNGIRIHRKASPYSIMISQIYNVAQCFFFNLRVNDVSSTYMAVKKDFVRGLKLRDNDHRYIVPIMAHRGAKISEVCVVHGKRKYGQSKYSPLKVFWAAVETLLFAHRLRRGDYRR